MRIPIIGRRIRVAITLLATFSCTAPPRPAAVASTPVPVAGSGFYSAAQAARGREVFRSICSECHDTVDFRGADFEWDWRRQTAWDLYETMMETMPEDAPGSMSPETCAAVIAYILQLNDYTAGAEDLLPAQQSMDSVPLGPDADKTGRSSSATHDRQ